MSALTIGLLVVLPSKMESDSQAFTITFRRVRRAHLPLNEAVRDGGQEKSPARGGAS